MIMSVCLMLIGHELGCIANRLGGGLNVGLTGGASPSPKGLDKRFWYASCCGCGGCTNSVAMAAIVGRVSSTRVTWSLMTHLALLGISHCEK